MIAHRSESRDTPLCITHGAAVAFNGTLLAFGGFVQGHDVRILSDRIYFLSVCTKTSGWTEVVTTGSLPPPRRCHTAALGQGDVMIIHGGVGKDETVLQDCYCFHTRGRHWTSLPNCSSLPALFDHASCVSKDGASLFLHGGFDQMGDCNSSLYEVSIHGNAVERFDSPANLISHRAAVTTSGNLILYGGQRSNSTEPNVSVYLCSLQTKLWSVIAPLAEVPAGISGFPMAFDDATNSVVACGAIGMWRLQLENVREEWERGRSGDPEPSDAQPQPHERALVITVGAFLWSVGGMTLDVSAGRLGKMLFRCELSSGTWSSRPVSARLNVLSGLSPVSPAEKAHTIIVPPRSATLPCRQARPHSVGRLPARLTARIISARDRKVERIIAHNLHSAWPRSAMYMALSSNRGEAEIDLNVEKAPTLLAEDVMVASWMLQRAPHIKRINLSGQRLDTEVCRALLRVLDDSRHVVDVCLVGCISAKDNFAEIVEAKVSRNRQEANPY